MIVNCVHKLYLEHRRKDHRRKEQRRKDHRRKDKDKQTLSARVSTVQ